MEVLPQAVANSLMKRPRPTGPLSGRNNPRWRPGALDHTETPFLVPNSSLAGSGPTRDGPKWPGPKEKGRFLMTLRRCHVAPARPSSARAGGSGRRNATDLVYVEGVGWDPSLLPSWRSLPCWTVLDRPAEGL
jgi:hypothetical protein